MAAPLFSENFFLELMKKYELINGVFEWAEAREILIHIILKKIQFHNLRNLRSIEQTGKPHQASLSRIQQLENVKKEILQEDKDDDESLYNLKAYVEIETLIHA
jgi:hypothetical protein